MMTTDVTQRALPAADFSGHPDQISAYNIILRAEREAQNSQNQQDVMSARVVGFMLLEFHERRGIISDSPCSTLTKWVTSPPREQGESDRDVVYRLGILLREKFIRLFRTPTTQYPPPSSHPSRPSFGTLEDMIRDTLEPTDQRQTGPRQKALARDGFQCMITGIFNTSSVKDCPGLLDQASQEGRGTIEAVIETAHILNESTMQAIDAEGTGKASIPNNTEYAATAMAMLEAFGFSRFTEAFRRSGGIHKVWNLLSLQHDLHRSFDVLDLWFEHTEKLCYSGTLSATNSPPAQPGRYRICVSKQGHEDHIRLFHDFQRPRPHVVGAPMFVEFTSQFQNAPPPEPLLLALHAVCARVAHMSGAAKHFDKLERDGEGMKVLACDGSNAALLSHLLSPLGTLEAEPYVQTETVA